MAPPMYVCCVGRMPPFWIGCYPWDLHLYQVDSTISCIICSRPTNFGCQFCLGRPCHVGGIHGSLMTQRMHIHCAVMLWSLDIMMPIFRRPQCQERQNLLP